MNRQALAFLTMFSLILMLSVYYVTLPADTTAVMSSEDGEVSKDSQNESEKDMTNDAEKLQEEITSRQEAEVKKQSEVVSNADSSDAQKQEALAAIDDLKSDQANAELIKQILSDNQFMAAVEISEGTCRINVFENEDSAENAKKIMDLASSAVTEKYLIEVTFK